MASLYKPRIVSIKFRNLINYMVNICLESSGRYRLASVLLSSNKSITNTFAINDGLNHAETKSINLYKNNKFRNIYKYPRKWDILVIRINSYGNLCGSKPCENCLKEIYKYNIKGIYYVDDEGILVYENILNITTTHISNGNRQLLLRNYYFDIHEKNQSLIYENKQLLGINEALLKFNKKHINKSNIIRRNINIIRENNKIIEQNNKKIENNNTLISFNCR